jgi:hypothetical protein
MAIPLRRQWMGEDDHQAKVLPVFRDREEAQDFEDGLLDEGETATPMRQIANADELLRAFADIDVVEVDGVDFPLTHAGARYSKLEGFATIEQIAAALSRIARLGLSRLAKYEPSRQLGRWSSGD